MQPTSGVTRGGLVGRAPPRGDYYRGNYGKIGGLKDRGKADREQGTEWENRGKHRACAKVVPEKLFRSVKE